MSNMVDYVWLPVIDALAKAMGKSRAEAAEALFAELPNAWRRVKQEAMGLPEEIFGILPLDPAELLKDYQP